MSVEMLDYNWRAKAACYGASDEELFPEDSCDDAAARQYCVGCPVRELCLAEAVRLGDRAGIRGGLSEAARSPLHDAAEEKSNSLSARKLAIGRKYSLTLDDRVELSDLRSSGRRTTSQADKRAFRIRLGELYDAGIEKGELLDAIESTFPTRHAAERMFWRGLREYRDALASERKLQVVTEPAAVLTLVPAPKPTSRALENFLHLAEHAATDSARRYWRNKAEALICD